MGPDDMAARSRMHIAMTVAPLIVAGCMNGGSHSNGAPGNADGVVNGVDASGRIVKACQGMDLVGMQYSPGGTILPNKCAPFDVANNNPFAVRCIDAMPDFHTPFTGDEFCILPPPPALGFQFGVHPGGNLAYWGKMRAGDYSFYSDSALTATYEVPSGQELLQNYNVDFEAPSGEPLYYYRTDFRGRPGSHHGTAAFTGSPVTEGWQDNGNLLTALGSTQLVYEENQYADIPQSTLEISREEQGIGTKVQQNSGIVFNLHHVNATAEPVLRENWVNVWYIPSNEVTKQTSVLYQMASVNYPPDTILDNENSITASGDTQILSMYGHRHAWTTRFSAWITRADGGADAGNELVYDSYNWDNMPTYAYNSITENPKPGTAGGDGARSGDLVLHKGDELHFDCHVETTPERAQEIGQPAPTVPLTWANEVFSAEMCSVQGMVIGAPLNALLGPGGI